MPTDKCCQGNWLIELWTYICMRSLIDLNCKLLGILLESFINNATQRKIIRSIRWSTLKVFFSYIYRECPLSWLSSLMKSNIGQRMNKMQVCKESQIKENKKRSYLIFMIKMTCQFSSKLGFIFVSKFAYQPILASRDAFIKSARYANFDNQSSQCNWLGVTCGDL